MRSTALLIGLALCLTSCARQSAEHQSVSVLDFDPGRSVAVQINGSPERPVQYEVAWDGSVGGSIDHPVILKASVTGAKGYRVELFDAGNGGVDGTHVHHGDTVQLRGTKRLLPFMTSRTEDSTTIWFQHAFLDAEGQIVMRLTVFEEGT